MSTKQTLSEGLGIPDKKAAKLAKLMKACVSESDAASEAITLILSRVEDPIDRAYMIYMMGVEITEANCPMHSMSQRIAGMGVVAIKTKDGKRPSIDEIMRAIMEQEGLDPSKRHNVHQVLKHTTHMRKLIIDFIVHSTDRSYFWFKICHHGAMAGALVLMFAMCLLLINSK